MLLLQNPALNADVNKANSRYLDGMSDSLIPFAEVSVDCETTKTSMVKACGLVWHLIS